MAKEDENRIALIAEAIERYIREHPNAADSIEDICGFWVVDERLEPMREEVQEALDYLVARDVLIRIKMLDNHVIYSSKQLKHH